MDRFYTIVLYFQAFWSIWQFIRDTKYLRLLYLFLHSLIVGKITLFLPFKKDVYRFKRYIDLEEGEEIGIDGDGFDPYFKLNEIIYTGEKSKLIQFLVNALENGQAVSGPDMDVLAPGLFYFRCCSVEDIINYSSEHHLTKIKGIRCFVGYTLGKDLNKNFLRLVSIFPLTLQARGFHLYSVVLSITIILMDFFSTFFNEIWQKFKISIYKYVKLSISNIKEESTREFIHTFLQTISKGFMYCDVVNKKSYNVKCKGVILNDFHFSKISGNGYKVFKFRDQYNETLNGFIKLSCKINNCLFEAIPVLTPENNDEEFQYSMRAGGVEYFNGPKNLEQLSSLHNLFRFIEDHEDVYLVETIKFGRMHIPSPKQFFYQSDFNNYVVLFDKEREIFLSAYEITDHKEILDGKSQLMVQTLLKDVRCLRIMKKYPSEKHIVFKLLLHNFLFFKNAEMFSEVERLLQRESAPYRREGVGNSEWKKYTSDFSLILNESGKKKLSSCCILSPSVSLRRTYDLLKHSEVTNFINDKVDVDKISCGNSKDSAEVSKKMKPVSAITKIETLCQDLKKAKSVLQKKDPKINEIIKEICSYRGKIGEDRFSAVKKVLAGGDLNWGTNEVVEHYKKEGGKPTKNIRNEEKIKLEEIKVARFKESYKDCLMKVNTINMKDVELKNAIAFETKIRSTISEINEAESKIKEITEKINKIEIKKPEEFTKVINSQSKIEDVPLFKRMINLDFKIRKQGNSSLSKTKVWKEITEYKEIAYQGNYYNSIKPDTEEEVKRICDEVGNSKVFNYGFNEKYKVFDKSAEKAREDHRNELTKVRNNLRRKKDKCKRVESAISKVLKSEKEISIKSQIIGSKKNSESGSSGAKEAKNGRLTRRDVESIPFISFRSIKHKSEKISDYGKVKDLVAISDHNDAKLNKDIIMKSKFWRSAMNINDSLMGKGLLEEETVQILERTLKLIENEGFSLKSSENYKLSKKAFVSDFDYPWG